MMDGFIRPSAARSKGSSHQKQRDSSRLTATNKNPRNLFGLEASKIAHNLSLPGLRDFASGYFKMSYCERNK